MAKPVTPSPALRTRKVKILATVGPASSTPKMLAKLYAAGVDAFRVNMSHGDHALHAATIAAIRALEKDVGRPIAILCDLQGPKLRVGQFTGGKAFIRHSAHFTLDRDPTPGPSPRSAPRKRNSAARSRSCATCKGQSCGSACSRTAAR